MSQVLTPSSHQEGGGVQVVGPGVGVAAAATVFVPGGGNGDGGGGGRGEGGGGGWHLVRSETNWYVIVIPLSKVTVSSPWFHQEALFVRVAIQSCPDVEEPQWFGCRSLSYIFNSRSTVKKVQPQSIHSYQSGLTASHLVLVVPQ